MSSIPAVVLQCLERDIHCWLCDAVRAGGPDAADGGPECRGGGETCVHTLAAVCCCVCQGPGHIHEWGDNVRALSIYVCCSGCIGMHTQVCRVLCANPSNPVDRRKASYTTPPPSPISSLTKTQTHERTDGMQRPRLRQRRRDAGALLHGGGGGDGGRTVGWKIHVTSYPVSDMSPHTSAGL